MRKIRIPHCFPAAAAALLVLAPVLSTHAFGTSAPPAEVPAATAPHDGACGLRWLAQLAGRLLGVMGGAADDSGNDPPPPPPPPAPPPPPPEQDGDTGPSVDPSGSGSG